LLTAGFAWLLHAGALPIVPPEAAFEGVRWWAVAGYAGIWTLILLARATRWYWLLAPVHRVPMGRVMRVAFIGLMAVSVLPFRTGELVRPTLIVKRGKLAWWAATGTVGAERVCDGLFLSCLLFLGLLGASPAEVLPGRIGELPVPVSAVSAAAYSALGVFAGALVVLAAFYWRREWATRVTQRCVGLVAPRLATHVAQAMERFADGLRFLPRARYAVPFAIGTAIYWLLNVAGTELLLWGCGIEEVSFLRTCVLTGILSLGILVPNAPGFFGSFQFSLYAALALYYPPETVVGAGAAFVFLLYVAQVGLTLILGAVALALDHFGD
jgi:uncharacterized protein (TIRG00374 family)